jgi:2-dehydro-3-deoxyglucarate aldolase
LKNPLKEKLDRGEVVIGGFVGLGHPDVTEWLARVGFDWVVIDGEHGPLSFETMQRMMQAMNGTSCIPIIRVQWNEPVVIKRVLDLGAYGVLIPWVNTKEEAENAVKACKYPPEGIRGCGPRRAAWFDPSYVETANKELLVIIQIETEKAVSNIDEILSVKGIDACYIGPRDLSVSMGFGSPPKWDEPVYREKFDIVLKAASRCGKPVGMFTTIDNVEWAIEKGFRLNTIDNADVFFIRSARMALEKARHAIAEMQSSK